MTHATHGRIRLGLLVAVAAALTVGVATGVRWHAQIGRVFGPRQAPAPGEPAGLWTCGMHPQVIQDHPGECPICHMKLTPVRSSGTDSPAAGRIAINPTVVQNMGIRTAPVTDGPLRRTVRAAGTLEEAATGIRDISLRVSGWVRKVHVAAEGSLVDAGSPLFDLFSPELNIAVDELIAARAIRDEPGGASIYESTSKRLRLLGLDDAQVASLESRDRAPEVFTFKSPIAGSIVEKPIVEGAAISAGDRALRIVDHSLLWLDAKVFEQDLPFVKVGSKASATVESRPRNTYEGEIMFVHPHADPATRTATARMEIRNAGLALKPGMSAIVTIETQLAERAVLVPREAVIDTGDSQRALVDLGGGRFEARSVKLGLSGSNGEIQVLSGLAAGEVVVTSGQFLLDSESRARDAMQKFASGADERPSPGPRIEVTVALRKRIDGVVAAYLAVWDALGAEQKEATPINSEALQEAARVLLMDARGSGIERIAANVSRSIETMRGLGIDQQREAFKQVSRAMIALVDAAPPSAAVGKTLYLMHCPMTKAPGDWLQDREDLANPYYATDMKSCGETVRTISTEGGTP